MATSRESFNIWRDIKRKDWKRVGYILKSIFNNKWSRKMIIKDSIITPFNKRIGCKLFGHRWSTEEDDKKYDFEGNFYCWKCGKWETKEQRRDSKIKSILK